MSEAAPQKRYVLVIKSDRVALGPFDTADDAEYAAMDYYGTAITGASARGDFLIADLRPADAAAVERQHAAHVAALLVRDG